MRTGRVGIVLVVIGALLGGSAERALAQAGAGAQRYEVTITPPKRTGSEQPAENQPGADETGDAPQEAPDNAGAADAAGPARSGTNGAAAAPDGSEAGSGVAAVAPPSMQPVAVPAGPPRSLQVGAFRTRRLADDLQRKLAAACPDVVVVEVLSGGEPLYRVHVGRIARGPQLDALKRDLLAAGHASFEVPAPSVD